MQAKIKTMTLAFIILFITVAIITFPEQTLEASKHGLQVWWEIVFPSLLPFFIVAELLISFGIVRFFGVLFEPVMRPLFNVPGSASFAWILGNLSGFPSGANITVLLREKKDITQIEAERLLSFSNAASPLFIFGAIAVGFFHNVQLGVVLALGHYISNIAVGLIMKRHGKQSEVKTKTIEKKHHKKLHRAFGEMHRTRIKETRPFGELFGDAVLTSIQTLLMVGGFIIIFSVLTALLQLVHIITLVQALLMPLFMISTIPIDILPSLINGFFEITIGAETISKTSAISLEGQLLMVSLILGFNGLSIQAQVASIIARTDIRFRPYLIARLYHACLATIFTYVIYKVYTSLAYRFVPTFSKPSVMYLYINKLTAALTKYGPIFTMVSIFVATAILVKRYMKAID